MGRLCDSLHRSLADTRNTIQIGTKKNHELFTLAQTVTDKSSINVGTALSSNHGSRITIYEGDESNHDSRITTHALIRLKDDNVTRTMPMYGSAVRPTTSSQNAYVPPQVSFTVHHKSEAGILGCHCLLVCLGIVDGV
ncbi:MAG: hypothetical protein ACRENW_08850 [Thermodesulfobacteriota bacterium]